MLSRGELRGQASRVQLMEAQLSEPTHWVCPACGDAVQLEPPRGRGSRRAAVECSGCGARPSGLSAGGLSFCCLTAEAAALVGRMLSADAAARPSAEAAASDAYFVLESVSSMDQLKEQEVA